MSPITIETFTEFKFVSNPTFSPDGTAIAFLVQKADLKTNGYLGDLYLYRLTDKKVIRLTGSGDVKDYLWTVSGTLLFPSAREGNQDGHTLYYEIDPCGGEAVKAFQVPFKVSAIYAVDSDRYLFLASVRPDSLTKAEYLVEPLMELPADHLAYEVFEELPFWSNGQGFTKQSRRRLFLYEVSSKKLTPVSEESADVSSFSVRGNQILFKAYPWTDIRNEFDGIYLYDMKSGKTRCLLKKDTLCTGLAELWSEDEALIAANPASLFEDGKYLDFYTMNLSTGQMTLLTPYDFSIGSGSVCSDARLGSGRTVKTGDGICFFLTTRGSSTQLYSINRKGVLKGIVTAEGSCDSFDIQNGHVAACGLYGNRLAELYLDGQLVTCFNDMGRWQVSTPKPYTFTAGDGYELTGWVMEPAGYRKGNGKKYPAILHIHGGPRAVFGTVFHHEMQAWASAGYFVFFTNPRGSDGFGTEFGDISGKYGTVDYDNLMDFTDYILDHEPHIDRERIGVTGGSYGGFMVNWIIGHTNRFRAAASQRSIANWISYEYMSDIGHTFTKSCMTVSADEDADKLWFHSPLRYIADCKTPVLFVHSDEDFRCHLAEGLQMFAALKILGVETRMCVLKGENHNLSRSGKPRNRIVRMQEILNWMDRHLKIKEDPAVLEKEEN